MTMKNEKGTGVKLANQLNANQKVQLTLFLHGLKDSGEKTYQELNEMAVAALGFPISLSSIENTWTAIYGPRVVHKKKRAATVEDRLAALESGLKKLNDAFGIGGLK
jgi:hypothetical protein